PTGAPDELMSKPRWQRALISFAGPAVNLVFPILLLTGLYAIKGEPYPEYFDAPLQIVGVSDKSPAALRAGDKVLSVDNVTSPTWEQADRIVGSAPAGSSIKMDLENGGARRTALIEIPKDNDQLSQIFGYAPILPIIDEVSPGYPADRSGLQMG